MVVGALAAVLGVVAVVRGVGGEPSGGTPDAGSTVTVTVTQVPVVATAAAAVAGDREPCPEGMVPVPAGTFTMGAVDGDLDEKPHEVKLRAFCIDRTEVTVADYRRCTKEARNGVTCVPAPTTAQTAGYSAEEVKRWNKLCNGDRADKDRHPINCVDWTQAEAYCKWAGGSLPSEAQWEYAARGTDGRRYPWGNVPPGPSLLNACGSECAPAYPGWKAMYKGDDKWRETAPVGAYPDGASPCGALDMAGNVLEWVADWYAPSYPAEGATIPEDPKGPDASPESRRVMRGSGWLTNDASMVRAAYRTRGEVSGRFSGVGFRCVRGREH